TAAPMPLAAPVTRAVRPVSGPRGRAFVMVENRRATHLATSVDAAATLRVVGMCLHYMTGLSLSPDLWDCSCCSSAWVDGRGKPAGAAAWPMRAACRRD